MVEEIDVPGGVVRLSFATGMAGGFGTVVQHAADAGKFQFWPTGGSKEWWAFVAAWATLAIGSIPQQDVFQRVTSAKDESTAVKGSLLGAGAYFALAFVPMFIAYAAFDAGLIDIELSGERNRGMSISWISSDWISTAPNTALRCETPILSRIRNRPLFRS